MTRTTDQGLNTALPEDTGDLGKLQRLHFNIPNPHTMLVLGERWKDDPAFGYQGASLRTDQHLFFDITRKTLFQGHEAVVFQTTATFTQYSSDATFVHAAKNLDLTSASQLVLSALPDTGHSPPVGADMQALTGDDLPTVATYTDLRDSLLSRQGEAVDQLKSVASALDDALKKLGSHYRAGETEALVTKTRNGEDSLRVGHTSTAAGIGLVSEHPVVVTTHAEVLSHAVKGYHLAAGTSDDAADVDLFASRDVAAHAGRDAVFQAQRHAVVEGVESASVSSHGPALLASRAGRAEVLAPDVLLGSKAPGGVLGVFPFDHGTQKATDNVKVESNTLTSVDSGDKVDIKAANKVTIAVGDFKVMIETSKLTVGTASGVSLMEIKNGEITITTGSVDSVKMKIGGTTITSGASTVATKASGVSIAGPQIKLG